MTAPYDQILPFLWDSFDFPSDNTPVRALSDFLKDRNDFRGWLTAIPLFVLDYPFADVQARTTREIPTFKLLQRYTATEYQAKQLHRRIAALFVVGLLLNFSRATRNSAFAQDPVNPNFRSTLSARHYRTLNAFRVLPEQLKPKLSDLIDEFIYRMWFYHSGLLSLEDRDYDWVVEPSGERQRVNNCFNFRKLEWTCLAYDRIGPLRSPRHDMHIPLAYILADIQNQMAKYDAAALGGFDLSRFSISASYAVTCAFLQSELVREMTQHFSWFFLQRQTYRDIRKGPAHVFV